MQFLNHFEESLRFSCCLDAFFFIICNRLSALIRGLQLATLWPLFPLPDDAAGVARVDAEATAALSNLKPLADAVVVGGFWDDAAAVDCVVVVEERVGKTLDETVILDKSVEELDNDVVLAAVVMASVDKDLVPREGAVVFGTLVEDDADVVAVDTAVRLPKFAASPANPIGLFAEVVVLPCVIVGYNRQINK